MGGSGGEPADRSARSSGGSALWRGAAGGAERCDARADGQRRRSRCRRRREHEQYRVLHHRHALGSSRRLGDAARSPAARARAIPACRALRVYLRDDRDGREPGSRIPHFTRRGRRVRSPQPQASGRRVGLRRVRPGDRAHPGAAAQGRGDQVRARRGDPRRCQFGIACEAVPHHEGRNRDGRQFESAKRRGCRVPCRR